MKNQLKNQQSPSERPVRRGASPRPEQRVRRPSNQPFLSRLGLKRYESAQDLVWTSDRVSDLVAGVR